MTGSLFRIRELCCHVQLEVGVVGYDRIAHLNVRGRSNEVRLFEKDRVQRRFQGLTDTFQQAGEPKTYRPLDGFHEFFVICFAYLKVVPFVEVANPEVGLSLGVNQKGPPARVVHNDRVLSGETVRW